LGSSLSLDDTLSLLCARLRPLVHFDAVAVYVRRGETLFCEYSEGSNADIFSRLEIPVGEGPSGWVAYSGKALMNASPALEPGYITSRSSADGLLHSALAIPLGSADEMKGVLTLYRTERDGFTQNDQRVLLAISSKLGICIENALKFQQVEDSATTDYLTGLPNTRSLFLHLEREIARCKRLQTPLAVMLCDLNGFKKVKDMFGHLEGNRILKEFAGVLREVCREYDYVARMGGDEFVIIAPGMGREAAQERAVALNRRVEEIGERICGTRLLSISVGSSFHNEDGTSAEQLLREADRRMYSVKEEYYEQVEASEEELRPKQRAL
jgi:diguanylate cyclase (GGDEF)-like protein